jgi:predicted ATP-grasp superfamily ATP-dependent carboligase
MNRHEHIPAIIVGQTITVLGTLRSLAREGINAFTVTAPEEIVQRSRWYKPIPGQENLRPDELTNWLPELDIERAVLLPCSDHAVWQASRLKGITKSHISMPIAATDVLETLVDKARFATVLERIDIPRPRTWALDDGQIPASVPAHIFANAFLKPVDSQSFIRHFGVKAMRVQSADEATIELQQINRLGYSVLLQEYIPGGTDRHFFIDGFVDRHYEVKALFARRRLRMHPVDFGNSSCMVSIPLDDIHDAVGSLRRLLSEINFNGIFSAEFKFDERDREFKIIEVNARPWWYIEFASRCGVNVCEMAYADALGEEVDEIRNYRTGAHLVYLWHDFKACSNPLSRGDTSILTCIAQWIRSWRPIFAWDDPWPGVVNSSKYLLSQLSRPLRRKP